MRNDSKALLKSHCPKDPLAVPICRQKKQFTGRGNTEYMRDQFPLTLCYAVTAHKSQGQTLEEVLIDFRDARINNGSFYTAISRVKFGNNLFLRDFKTSYIKANSEVEKKMESMKIFKAYKFKKVYNTESIFSDDGQELKLGYVNINDLSTSQSIQFMNEDTNLISLDFLVIADTRLNGETGEVYLIQELTNWIVEARFDSEDKLKHMGMLVLKSKKSNVDTTIIIGEKQYSIKMLKQIQLLFVTFSRFNLNAAFIYIRETPTQDQVNMLIKDLERTDLVMGDLNLDPNRSKDLGKLKMLCSERTRVLNEITTKWFNQLDHILLNCKQIQTYFSTSFINHSSDHHTICIRIAIPGNVFKPSFLEKITFNADAETRQKATNMEKQGKPLQNLNSRNFDKKKRGPTNQNMKQDNHYEEKANMSDEPKQINLRCLFSPNWLNDEVINGYLELLGAVDDNVFVYTTYFHQAFLKDGFERVKTYYQKYNPLSFKTILIPVHHQNHWFLITFNGSELVSIDPYNCPGASEERRRKFLQENFQFHSNILMNLRENYFKPLYQKYNKTYTDLSIIVKLPPAIPSQDNSHDCGVFLIMFAKYLVFQRPFDFSTDDMIHFRDTIRSELESNKILNAEESNQSTKRKQSPPKFESVKRKKTLNQLERSVQRRIINPDAETCWLNSCLQLVLTALDYKEYLSENGSVLWDQLLWMKGKDPSIVLDPTDVKLVIVQAERERIIRDNIAPNHMLFDLGNLPNVKDGSHPVSIRRIGQQDCKDFFYCLDENRQAWPDVYDFLKVNTTSKTQCVSCKNTSTQEFGGTEKSFISLPCPNKNVTMKQQIEEKMNIGELVHGWRDEEGCKEVSEGRNSQRISNIDETEYVIFVLERLIRIGGNLHIINTQVTVEENEEITLLDKDERSAKFFPIAIIHHSGNVIGETTQGHYRADVRNKDTTNWYRTSDNDCPKMLSGQNLTKMGYIFLYKKSSIEIEIVETMSNEARPRPESELLSHIICFLDEMNLDLVFSSKFNRNR